jgi:hypothetical protein
LVLLFAECDCPHPYWLPDLAEIDCRRTDRTQPLFATEDDGELPSYHDPSSGLSHERHSRAESGGQPPSNRHVRKLQEILLTYNAFEKDLGYVQGMSDLCSPLYVVMGGDEVLTFWAFVGLMDRMVRDRPPPPFSCGKRRGG